MPRAQKPCVDCGKQITPNYADSVPRCKPCTTKLQRSRQKAEPMLAPKLAEELDYQDELIAYRTKRAMPAARGGIKIMMIPDLQVGPGTPTDHLDWIAKYAIEKRPDVIVQIGDWADMPSLSSYDRGKKVFEGRRIKNDLDAVEASLERLTNPIAKAKGYSPKRVVTLGNHEDRITRAINEDARLEGILSLDDLRFREHGWETHPFLTPVKIEGIEFAHYFTSGVMQRPIGTAKRILDARHGSAIAGHSQGFDIAVHPKTGHIAIICGAAYIHDEEYLGPQDNGTRRQIVMLHEVRDGLFDPMFVSLSYLEKRFKGGKK